MGLVGVFFILYFTSMGCEWVFKKSIYESIDKYKTIFLNDKLEWEIYMTQSW